MRSEALQQEREDREAAARKRRQSEVEKALARKEAARAALAVPFTQEDLDEGLQRLARVAFEASVQRTNNMAAKKAFECEMGPIEFRLQLRRSFGIQLSDAQFTAVFKHFDNDGGGTVDGAEFLLAFVALGTGEKDKEKERNRRNRLAKTARLNLVDFDASMNDLIGR